GAQSTLNPDGTYQIPAGTRLDWPGGSMKFSDGFALKLPLAQKRLAFRDGSAPFPKGAVQVVPGSSWGTFTIAATIPIALFIGFYMYRLRKGRVVEASLVGGGLVLAAVFVGGYVAHTSAGHYFNLSARNVTLWMAA